MAKEGSVVSGLMDSFATAVSLALQYGVPMQVLSDKFSHTRFEPSGFTGNPQLPIAKSIIDYIFRWMDLKFLPHDGQEAEQSVLPFDKAKATPALPEASASARNSDVVQPARVTAVFQAQTDAPPCHTCGSIMVRNGACYKCVNCGSTSGCS